MSVRVRDFVGTLRELRLRVVDPVGPWYLDADNLMAELTAAWARSSESQGGQIPPIMMAHVAECGEILRISGNLSPSELAEVQSRIYDWVRLPNQPWNMIVLLRDTAGADLLPMAVGYWPEHPEALAATAMVEAEFTRTTMRKIIDRWILRMESVIESGRKPDAFRPQVLPFNLHRCDVPQALRRDGFDKVVTIKNADHWELMEALMAAFPNAVSEPKLKKIFQGPNDRDNYSRALKNAIDTIGLTVEKWVLTALK